MPLLPSSTMMMLSLRGSENAMCGRERLAFVAKPPSFVGDQLFTLSPLNCPLPATVSRMPYEFTRFVKWEVVFVDISTVNRRTNWLLPETGTLDWPMLFEVKTFFRGTHGPVIRAADSRVTTPVG